MRQALVLLPLAFLSAGAQSNPDPLPRSTMSVLWNGAWHEWWSSTHAPTHYDSSNAVLAPLVAWHGATPGVELGALRVAGAGEAWRIRLVIARVDPSRVVAAAVPRNGIGQRSWTLDSMSADAALAVSAGQFKTTHSPWGWLVLDGVERQEPQLAPLGMAVAIDSSGGVTLLTAEQVVAERRAGPLPMIAFQSYPMALLDGDVPYALQAAGRGVDLAHRDGRLGICTLADGRVLIVITQFDALDGALAEVPVGTTTPEMSAVMGALGCRRALMLDGGISRQLGIRGGDTLIVRHKGWRSIPMGLEFRTR